MTDSKISLSAWSIAVSFDFLARSERWAVLVAKEHLPFYRQALSYCSDRSLTCKWLGGLPDAIKFRLIDRVIAYGAAQHFVLRKQAIEKHVRSSIESGIKQIIVLGGGFDLLAFTMAQTFPGIDCFEIDTPNMHTHKMELLGQCYGIIPANFYAMGIDLAQTPLHSAMASFPRFQADRPTLFVAEGLTMYLSETHVRTLFANLKQICSGGVSVIFTAVPVHPGAKGFWNRFRKLILGRGNETPSWSLLEKDMPEFLQQNGFIQQYQAGYSQLQRPYRSDREMQLLQRQDGEYLVFAIATGR